MQLYKLIVKLAIVEINYCNKCILFAIRSMVTKNYRGKLGAIGQKGF